MMEDSAACSSPREERIPVALQAVFLASNRGKEVHQPPPGCVASQVFPRNKRSLWARLGSERGNFLSPRRKSKTTEFDCSAIPNAPLSVSPHFVLIATYVVCHSDSNHSSNRLVFFFLSQPQPSSPRMPKHEISPRAYLGSTAAARGYSNKEFPILDTGYFNEPTPYQRASYGCLLLEVIRNGYTGALRRLLISGLSPNASNAQGETILHTVCRTSQFECFRLLMEFGANVQVCDDRGRSPLHVACWAENPSFEIIEMILDVDKRMLFLADNRGSTPLEYVRRENWTQFTKFLMSVKDKYWPDRDFENLGTEKDPELTLDKPNSHPMEDPRYDLSLNCVRAIAEGAQARPLSSSIKSAKSLEDGFTEYSDSTDSVFLDGTESEDNDEFSDSDEEDDEEDEDDDDYSETSFDEDEMKEILQSIGANAPVQWSK